MKKTFVGQVVSDKMDKTVSVLVKQTRRHPTYQKVISKGKKFLAHNEKGAKVGDLVRIEESRPMSKRKRFLVLEIVKTKK